MLTVRPETAGVRPGVRVLDVGCGEGRHLRATRRVPGVTGVGLDAGEHEVRDTARGLRELDEWPAAHGGALDEAGSWAALRGDIYRMPFADGVFDCVIASEVLEHLHRDHDALAEITRVLRPRGVLAVSVPREGPEAVCWALSRRYRETPGGHVRIYRRKHLRRMLVDAGYRVYASHFAHGLHTPYWWLKCAFGPDRDDVPVVSAYHRMLRWDLMRGPVLTRMLEGTLAPFIGKSVVMYATKGNSG